MFQQLYLYFTKIRALFLCFFISCSFSSKKQDLERRNLGEYFQGSEVIRYFLPPLPEWANQSKSGRCSRSESLNYLKFDDLMTTYSLGYAQAIQFQYMYNVNKRAMKSKATLHYLPFKEGEKLFYFTSERVQANMYLFLPPKYKRVHLIWIDRALKSKAELKKLKKVMEREDMNLGHPVFVSLCLFKNELEQFHQDHHFPDSVKFISYEMFSPYSTDGKLQSFESLNFSKLFEKDDLELYLYQPEKNVPDEFRGDFKLKFFK